MSGAVAIALLALVACDGGKDGDSGGGEAAVGPELTHEPPSDAVDAGEAIALEVTATDDDGVNEVTLYYRVQGSTYWDALPMEEGDGDLYSAEIPGDEVKAPGVEYYFKAEDQLDPPAASYLPVDYSQAPYGVSVALVGEALPWEESFEGGDLYSLGWLSIAEGFAGSIWESNSGRAYDGEVSVVHPRGYDGVSEMSDWLISPPLDLSGLGAIELTWREYGAATDSANHSLLISAGSPDPADGDYTLVVALNPPAEGEWSRSDLVDLSPWAGEQAVYLAWRYLGSYADDWYIDDVQVGPLSAEVDASFSYAPEALEPGDTAALTFTLENSSTVATGPLTVTVELPEGAGQLDAEALSLDALGGGAAADAVFSLAIDQGWQDNSYMALTLNVDDGSESWSFPFELLVGEPSTALIELRMGDGGLVDVVIGAGSPEAPALEERLYSDTPGPGLVTIEADLTPYFDHLPPAPGDDTRWYARVFTEGSLDVETFEITFGGEVYEPTVLPSVASGESAVVWIPEPPVPELVSVATDPSTLSPGDAGVTLTFDLTNSGAATTDTVYATLVNGSGSSVTLVDSGPKAITSGPWEEDEAAQVTFTFDVSPGHLSSEDLEFELVLTDGLEVWTLDTEVAVPWTVFRTLGVIITDDGGDGLLDAGESAELEILLVNVGGLDSDGVATATLSVAPGSAVSATIEEDSDSIGVVDSEEETEGEYSLTVDGGSAGDALDLVLTIEDDRSVYTASLQIVLGEGPWFYLSGLDDPTGDAYGYTLDIVNGQYRVNGDDFELRVTADAPFDTSKAFLEMWAQSNGDYIYLRAVSQSGIGSLQGYSSSEGFVTLDAPTVTYPDDTTLQWTWPVEDMGLSTPRFNLGFGAGWCGTETGSYCDHFPDGWGYYYDSPNYSDFFDVEL